MDNKTQEYTKLDDILTLGEVAEYLKVSKKTVLRLVHADKIPCAKVAGQWRFLRTVIEDWLIGRMRVVPKNDLARLVEEGDIVPLSRMLKEDLISLNIRPGSKREVLERIARPLLKRGVVRDTGTFVSMLLSREEMVSTAVGEGVALPHVRHPEENAEGGPLICVGVCREGTDFDAHDGKPTRLFFLLYTDSEVVHLRVMSKLVALLRSPDTTERIVGARSREEVLSIMLAAESGLSDNSQSKGGNP